MGRIWEEMREGELSIYNMKIILFPILKNLKMFLTRKSNLPFLLIQLKVLSKARGMEGSLC